MELAISKGITKIEKGSVAVERPMDTFSDIDLLEKRDVISL